MTLVTKHDTRTSSDVSGAGTLYMVATPIGHLDDITLRAIDVLRSVTVVAAEDTRRSRVLLAHVKAAPRQLFALHDHNETERSRQLLHILEQGEDVAVVSDAGTPLLSDPGFELVRMVNAAGIRVVPVPGASAVTALLSASPVPVARFQFEGFLPAKASQRRKRLQALTLTGNAVIFFEAPHRLVEALADIADSYGKQCQVVIGKELTKVHERILSGSVAGLLAQLTDDAALQRGEFVGIIAPGGGAAPPDLERDRILTVLGAELPPAQAARLAARLTGMKKSAMYDRARELAERGDDG